MRASSDSIPTVHRSLLPILALTFVIQSTTCLAQSPTISVPVLHVPDQRSDAVSDTAGAGAMAADQVAELSPSGMPPQYRSVRPGSVAPDAEDSADDSADDSTVRLLICADCRPVLAELTILVDRMPLGDRRRQRVGQLLNAAKELAAAAPAEPSESEDSPETAPPEASIGDDDAPGAEASSEEAADTETEGAGAADDPAPVPTAASTLASRLVRYYQATGGEPDAAEVAWYLDHWIDGPPLLLLDESFQAARSRQAPLLDILDLDQDGVISAEELAAAPQTLQRYDLDGDEVLSIDEIMAGSRRRGAADPAVRFDPPPVVLLDELHHSPLLARVVDHYRDAAERPDWLNQLAAAADRDGRDEIRQLLSSIEPEVRIGVRFDSDQPESSRLDVTTLAIGGDGAHVRQHAGSITIELADANIEFSAIQPGRYAASDQVSVGGVRDGYPLLPLVDRDEDGRLSTREIRGAARRLAVLDRNGDGRITPDELRPTLRVAIGLGPSIDVPLASVRRLDPPPQPAQAEPPQWFVRMDRNRDGDLTEREFLGTQEQFDVLDTDGDGLISIAEALESETNQQPTDGNP